ncbi:GNAT family protein [Nocardiopsis tropica]|uniref:GNAT family protein n=1 Tax=Nocardiopsis tropica TaxID=109330 RepID=A0ABU7KU67_9ACTN|nr:GNAT family protein [Nocardiopsis umidischolae]MEE2052824.1 GNAT family protein [Nocardiopsis umidischolae]
MHEIVFPHLETRSARLASTRERFGEVVHDELSGLGLGGLPGRGVFTSLWPKEFEGVAAQFFVEAPGTGRVGGYASLHSLNPNGRYVKCSLALDPAVLGEEGVTDAHALAVNYAFSMWNIRKVYFWTVDSGLAGLRATGTDTPREGTLTEYLRDGERLRSVRIFAVYREEWDVTGAVYVRAAVAGAGPA